MGDQLLVLMQKDPELAVSDILGQYGNLMNAIAMNILKNPQDAEDCIAETLLRFWKNYKNIKSAAKLKSYLCTVTRNVAIDMLRSRQKRMEHSLTEELREPLFISDAAFDELESEMIRTMLLSLGEPDAMIMLRRYWYCESVDEIASAVHLSRSAVRNRLFRSRQQLKEKLIKGGFVYDDQ